MKFAISGAGAVGLGFEDWERFCSLFDQGHDKSEDGHAEPPSPAPESMSKRERARAPYLVKLAVAAAEQACEASGYAPPELATVFASSMSDTEVTDYMCRTLIDNPSEMSPTKFHNSVHNAAAGYWAISNAVHKPATAISGAVENNSCLALIEAASQCDQEGASVLLVVYDVVSPSALKCIVDIDGALAFALVLTPVDHLDGVSPLAVIDVEEVTGQAKPNADSEGAGGQSLSFQNPAADLLPLLQSLAMNETVDLVLPLSSDRLLSFRSR